MMMKVQSLFLSMFLERACTCFGFVLVVGCIAYETVFRSVHKAFSGTISTHIHTPYICWRTSAVVTERRRAPSSLLFLFCCCVYWAYRFSTLSFAWMGFGLTGRFCKNVSWWSGVPGAVSNVGDSGGHVVPVMRVIKVNEAEHRAN